MSLAARATDSFDGGEDPLSGQAAGDAGPVRLVDTKQLWECYARAGAGHPCEEDLVKAYLPLVKTMAARLLMTLPSHIDEPQLYSAGLVGLLNAIRQYDARLSASFEPYAKVRIRGAMLDELRRMDWAPRSVHAKARKVQEAIRALEQMHGCIPEDAQVAAALGLSLSDYSALLDEIRPSTFICLDACAGDSGYEDAGDGGGSGPRSPSEHEVFADPNCRSADEVVARAELSSLIAQRIEQLPEFQRKILALYYYEGLRVNEIAQSTGFCPAHICQTHTKAILAIRAYVDRFERRGQHKVTNADDKTRASGARGKSEAMNP